MAITKDEIIEMCRRHGFKAEDAARWADSYISQRAGTNWAGADDETAMRDLELLTAAAAGEKWAVDLLASLGRPQPAKKGLFSRLFGR